MNLAPADRTIRTTSVLGECISDQKRTVLNLAETALYHDIFEKCLHYRYKCDVFLTSGNLMQRRPKKINSFQTKLFDISYFSNLPEIGSTADTSSCADIAIKMADGRAKVSSAREAIESKI